MRPRRYLGLPLEERRRIAILAGIRLEVVTAILARRRKCSQRDALRLSPFTHGYMDVYDLALNLVSRNRNFACPPRTLVYAYGPNNADCWIPDTVRRRGMVH